MRAFDGDDAGGPAGGSGSAGGGGPQTAVPMPDGIADAAAGADLAALLEDVPVEGVSGYDTVTYMMAAHRLATHFHGLFLKALLETGMRLPAPDDQVVRGEVPGEFAAEEARAALVWSRSRAEGTFGRAYQMFGQNPQIGAALLDAAIDEPRAKAFCDWTGGLADEHATRIIDELLPVAGKLTVGELIDRIKRMAIALDPEWAERRYRDSVRQRRVELRQTPDGTADLAGRDLPADRAKTGADRIHQLARACKSAGDKRPVDAIRADLFLGMLDGQFTGMTDRQIIDHVLAHPVADDPTDPGQSTAHSSGTGTGEPGGGIDNDQDDEPDDDPPDDDPPGGSPPTDDDPPGDHGDGNDIPPRSDTGGAGESPGGDDDDLRCQGDTAGAEPDPGWNVGELRIELSTLLGMDGHPAELSGFGYIPAAVGRPLAARMGSAEWRFVICTPDGVPICSGITTDRPAGQQNVRRDPKRGGILELQLTSIQLFRLATAIAGGEYTEWQDVINDIAGRYRHGILDTTNTARVRDIAAREAGPADPPEGRAGAGNTRNAGSRSGQDGDERRRRARAGLRRWVEARARYCQHPACRMPATQCDQDHRTDYAAGGLTVDENLDPGCRHDHRLQHDGGWVVYRPRGSDPITGPIVWVSPLGHSYESRPPPVMQPYPEPGSYYPGETSLPTWFTDLVENAKAARQGSPNSATGGAASTATGEPGATGTASRRSPRLPAEPPF